MFEIIRDIGAITRQIQNISNAEFRKLGLGNNAFLYVIRVYERPGMFMGELADSVQIDRTTAFRTVQKLVEKGYLRLEDDQQDKRLRRVFVTQQGKAIYPKLHAFEQLCSNQLLENLSQSEQVTLDTLLQKLLREK